MRRRRLSLIVALLLLAVLVCSLGRTIYAPLRQERLNHALMAAIKQNDTKQTLALLDQGADANARDEPPQHLSLWRLLLDRLHAKNPSPSNEPTALLLALKQCVMRFSHYDGKLYLCPPENPTLVQALLEKGADPNATDKDGNIALNLCSINKGQLRTIEMLLEQGANVNLPDQAGLTPFMYVLFHHDTDATWQNLINEFFRRGANVNTNIHNHYWEFPYHYSPLTMEVAKENVSMVRLLLLHHADPNIKTMEGTSLSLARSFQLSASLDGRQIIRLLKQAGAK